MPKNLTAISIFHGFKGPKVTYNADHNSCKPGTVLKFQLPGLRQYGLWSFQAGGTKLERFLHKNPHT